MPLKLITGFLVFVACCVNAQNAINIPQKGLQAYWSFSGNANDISGNNRNGKVYGATLTNDRFGNENAAYSFNGFTDYITTEYQGIFGNHPRALSFWAILTDTIRPSLVVSWGANDLFPKAGGRFDCGFNQNRAGATIGASDAFITFETQEPVYDGKWHHYLFQFNKTYLKDAEIYQDGELLTHEPARSYHYTKIFTRKDKNVTIGLLDEPGKDYPLFTGIIDDVAIYDRVFTKSEIAELVNAPDPLKKQNVKKWIYILLVIIFIILLVVVIVRLSLRRFISREKEKTRIKNDWYEKENRILLAQMDPHFIFNSLNTIQQFIVADNNEHAQLYLTKFARLIRKLLESNSEQSISLKDEKDIYEKYLEIESLRFNNVFDYDIKMPVDADLSTIFIPHFLVQPFIENAVCHGLLPKIGYKALDIIFERLDEKTMRCTVDDNGIGRLDSANNKNPDLPGKNKKLGINFVQQRLLIMSKMDGGNYFVEITDKQDVAGKSTGTKVVIQMPIINKP